jgi:HD-GYP domain-containing protein (c-di-GMP phosphodiesterase class II)
MLQASRLAITGKGYVTTVIFFGLGVVSFCVYGLLREPVPVQWFLLVALTLISGSITVQLPSSHASISISEVFVFLAMLLYGPSAATLVAAVDGLVISFWLAKRHRELHRALFNMSAPSIAAWISAVVFFATSGIAPLAKKPATLNQIVPFLVVSAAVYFCLNTWLITFAIALERRINAVKLWFSSFAWLSLTYICGASVAAVVAVYNRQLDFAFFGVILPILLVLYFTFRTTMGRLEDAHRHVDQLNTLYLSTIETLAMAIDAKDQVTHGHIRRVQSHAVFLARQVGVTDEKQIRAIEAAALLHDTGKLAVPEHILNKPGRLTFEEFEQMKLHASIGADLLSGIAFPYPVVPIVRHHHENWDGSGYPSGLSGTEIPIGARILAVVDCFDALTSDRPYRPRLSDEEALRILSERRGTMYDPLMVDTFRSVYQELPNESPAPAFRTVERDTAVGIRPPRSYVTAAATHLPSDNQNSVTRKAVDVLSKGEAIATYVRRLIPSSLCVVFAYDSLNNVLEAVRAYGEASQAVQGVRVQLKQRLDDWLAANQTTINSKVFLPLKTVNNSAPPIPTSSCLSAPFFHDGHFIGVLVMYSSQTNAFNQDHIRLARGLGYDPAEAITNRSS